MVRYIGLRLTFKRRVRSVIVLIIGLVMMSVTLQLTVKGLVLPEVQSNSLSNRLGNSLINSTTAAAATETEIIRMLPNSSRRTTLKPKSNVMIYGRSNHFISKSNLNIVLPSAFNSGYENFDCMSATVANMTFPVCVYTTNIDSLISGSLLTGGYFEEEEVSRLLEDFRRDPGLQFVDVGANIGVYSLPAARLTQVVAVEPNWNSIVRLAKAVDLGGVSSNITLVQNAISDVRTTLYIGVHPSNQGNAFLIETRACNTTPMGLPCNTLSQTRTVLLNDLLPLMRSKSALLKVDVEGHETNVFTESSAGRFFDQVNIPVVFMEWGLCKRRSAVDVERLLRFFRTRHYAAFRTDNSKLKTSYIFWPENVLFKKTFHFQF